LTPPYSERGN